MTYQVKPGDSLSSIAAALLGSASRWTEIYNLNKALIPNPNVITQGLILQLPAGASTTTAPVAAGASSSFFKSNQTMIILGVVALMGLSALPILMKKKKASPLATTQPSSATSI